MVSYKIKSMKVNKEIKIANNIKHNPKAFYQYIASKTIKREGIADLENEKGELINIDKEKCEILNNFFASVFTNESDDEIPNFIYDKDIKNPLNNCTVSESEIEKALFNLNPNKSPGPDNLHPKFLKLTSKTLAKPIKFYLIKLFLKGKFH